MPAQPSFHEGLLTVTDTTCRNMAVVRTGTPLLDVALTLEQADSRHALVRDDMNAIVGIVSQDDLDEYNSGFNRAGYDNWQARPIEDVMQARLPGMPLKPGSAVGTGVTVPTSVDCIPIIEHGRCVGVMTPDDVLVSWSRLEPALRAASTDDVTQLANRTMFMRRLTEEWNRSLRNHTPLALMLFDVDYFKQVNDQCGHMAGDAVLAGVGECVKQSLRSYDVVARIGGDEFAALSCHCDAESIDMPIQRIRGSLDDLPVHPALERGRLTLSIGAAIVRSGFNELTTDDLFSHADACLYKSKKSGRDRAYRVILDSSGATPPEQIGRTEYSEGSVDYLIDTKASSTGSNKLGRQHQVNLT